MTSTTSYRLSGRADVLGYLPYALGFHPSDSIVLVGLSRRRFSFCARTDLDWPLDETVRQLTDVLGRQPSITGVIIVAYADAAQPAGAVAGHLRAALEAAGYPVHDTLRVSGSRYHCLMCDGCTPPAGMPVDLSSTAGAALGTFQGMVAHSDRSAVAARVSSIGGPARLAMTQAVDRAEKRLAGLLVGEADPAAAMLAVGGEAVQRALVEAEAARPLDDDAVAWLSVLMLDIHVRDEAWLRTDSKEWQLNFWLDLTRRCEPLLAAPIATMLGWCAWRGGNGVLAGAALDRALRADPDYSLAHMISDALAYGLPPSSIGPWPTRRQRRRRRG
jgi:hypothetical protein